MKNGKRALGIILLCVMLLSLLTACGRAEEIISTSDTITVTDCVGRTVEVPKNPQSICCVCPFSGALIVMLGYGDNVTTSCNNMIRSNLLTAICPNIAATTVVKSSGSFNSEVILQMKTDLMFVTEDAYLDENQRGQLDLINVPYVVIGFDSLDSQLDAIMVIGKTLGNEKKAEEYTAWCREVYDNVKAASSLYEGTQIRLYHSINEATRTDYSGSVCAELIALTGVDNVSVDSSLNMDGSKAYATLEQIYLWNPDIIICNESGVDDYILTDEKWAGLRCVKDGSVYQMPVGIARMGHPTSTENPLAAMWLANLLYPDLYEVNFKAELMEYYSRFYDYEITDELADAILQADDMRVVINNPKVN